MFMGGNGQIRNSKKKIWKGKSCFGKMMMTKKWKLFGYAKSQEPQRQNKRSVRKRKARKHMLEKYFMAEAVKKLELCRSCFWKAGIWRSSIEELQWLIKGSSIDKELKKEFQKRKRALKNSVQICTCGRIAQGPSRKVQTEGLKTVSCWGRKCVWVPMAKSALPKKKWKGMSVFVAEKNKKNAEPPPIYSKWALGR